jgi:hypothetical protein
MMDAAQPLKLLELVRLASWSASISEIDAFGTEQPLRTGSPYMCRSLDFGSEDISFAGQSSMNSPDRITRLDCLLNDRIIAERLDAGIVP